MDEIIELKQDFNAEKEAMEFLTQPGLKSKILEDLESLGYLGEDNNKFLIYLVATSRKMPNPLACIVRGRSSAGKSELVETAALLIPEEEKKILTRVTKQSFFYKNKLLSHKFIFIRESEGCEDAMYAIRSLLSEKELVVSRVVGTDTKDIVMKGPVAYAETTTDAKIEAQKANRVFEIWIDESEESTSNIQRFQRKKHTLSGLEIEQHSQNLIKKHHIAQMKLNPMPVVIPYAEHIEFPCKLVRYRRDQERFLNLIEASAFLHQYQRQIVQSHGGKCIEATMKDYENAYELMEPILLRSAGDYGDKQHELLKGIIAMVRIRAEKEQMPLNKIIFTRNDIENFLGWKEKKVKDHIKKLESLEAIKVISGGRGIECRYCLSCDSASTVKISGLLKPDELDTKIKKL